MNASTMSLVVTAIAANVLASVLLKSAAIQPSTGAAGLPSTKVLLLGGFALFSYAIAFVVYAMVLRTLPISKAYALITFGAQTILILMGAFFFGERFEPTAWLGICMVFAGLILVARGAGA